MTQSCRTASATRLITAILVSTALTAPGLAQASLEHPGEISPGRDWQHATGVSGNGSFVTGQGYDGSAYRSFLMTSSGVVDMGLFNGDQTFAQDVSSNGVVVGNAQGAGNIAFRWTGDGGYENLGRLEMLNGGATFATSVSDDGTRIVGHSYRQSRNAYEAFIWVEGANSGVLGNEQMYSLGVLVPGGDSVSGGISSNGRWAVGQAGNAAAQGRAVRWSLADIQNASNTIIDLGTLGGSYSAASDVSNDGSVVVGWAANAAGDRTAFRWVEGGTGGSAGNVQMYELGSFGGEESEANAVTANGAVVVGKAENASGMDEAFRWTQGAGMVRVSDWLAANGVDIGTLELRSADGVSNDGNVIAGQSRSGGNARAYIARVGARSGLMDVAEFTHSLLANARTAQMGVDLSWLPLNGAHHRPLMAQHRVEDDTCLWSMSDLAGKDSGGMALTEVGGCGALGDGSVMAGLGVGASTAWQALPLGGSAQLSGAYVVGEVDWQPDGTPLMMSLTGVLGGWQANIDRAYSNGAATDISTGSTGVTAGVVRARLDWEQAAVFDNVSINPWISASIGRTEMGGYVEQGGAFPARFNTQSITQGEVRLGVTAIAELSPETSLSTTLELAHRAGTAPATDGQVLGLFEFGMGGGQTGSTWARAGLDLDHDLTETVRFSGSLHAATQGQDATISGSLGLKAVF